MQEEQLLNAERMAVASKALTFVVTNMKSFKESATPVEKSLAFKKLSHILAGGK